MKRISSRATFFQKRIFPFGFLGLLAIFVIAPFTGSKPNGKPPVVYFFLPLLFAGYFYFLMKKLVFDLADEVFDDGDALVVRFGSEQERIPLSEIINLSYSSMVNPSRVTLTMRIPGRFGKQIAFSPPQRILPFTKSPVIDDLIERMDAARRA